MALPLPTRSLTVTDLEALGSDADGFELYDGALRAVETMGGRHGEIQYEIGGPLYAHVRANRLGRIYPSDTHFILFRDPDTVVKPDVSFVRADRLPPEAQRQRTMPIAPDFAVEVLSPSNRLAEIEAKVALYLRAGVALVWVVSPRSRSVTVFALSTTPITLREGETLDGVDVIPGFTLPVADIFL